METCADAVSIRDRAKHRAPTRHWAASMDYAEDRPSCSCTRLGRDPGLDNPLLLAWIEAETERFIPLWTAARPSRNADAIQRFRQMLQLLCFAYSLGVTRSAEIVEACVHGPEFKSVVGNFRPFTDELKSFRRRHRSVIEVVLARVFFRAAIWHAEFDSEAFPPKLEEQCTNMAEALLNLARHLDSCDDC